LTRQAILRENIRLPLNKESPVEIELDTCSDINHSDSYFAPLEKSEPALHEAIRLQSSCWSLASHRISLLKDLSPTDRKTQASVSNRGPMKLMKIGGSVDTGVEMKWGGKDGVKIGGHIGAEIHDDKGNYGQITITQNGDGTGSANASGGYKEN
jgi:hypothetical protein